MRKSPGHQRWPNHKVKEEHLHQRVKAEVDGEVLADSNDVIVVREDENPVRYYFPRSSVEMDKLEQTRTTAECPFKGKAHYFSVKVGEREFKDAAWSYDEPYDEHSALKNRMAFDDTKIHDIRIRTGKAA